MKGSLILSQRFKGVEAISLIEDEHSLSIAKVLILGLLTKENYTEDELSRMLALHTDFTWEDAKYIIWLLKGEGSITRINGGLGISPEYKNEWNEKKTYAFTTFRNVSTKLGRTI